MERLTRLPGRLVPIALVVLAAACNERSPPTALEAEPAERAPLPAPTFERNAVFSDRAHSMVEGFEMTSSAQEVEAGLYRFRPTGAETPEIRRDDFIVTEDGTGTTVVRRVLEAVRDDGELRIDTGPAYWHDVIRGGTYTLTVPIGEGAPSFVGPAGVPLEIEGEELSFPPLGTTFADVDACAWLHAALDAIPAVAGRRVCGEEVEVEVEYGVTFKIAGTLDTLRILEGNVRLLGDMDLSMSVESGSVTGGRLPVFAPCDRSAYLGCLTTPTGAAFIEFLRRYAPIIPEASLSPVRVCVPGTPVRTRRGYWSGLTFNPPVWEECRVTDSGELPAVVLPSVHAAANEFRPRIAGEMTIRVVGDGEFAMEVPIPGLSIKKEAKVTNDFKAEVALGLFVLVRATLENGGATLKLTFDDTGRVTQTWTTAEGWEQEFDVLEKSNHAEVVELNNADSITVRLGIPVKAKAEMCIALWGCGKTEEEGGDPDTEFHLTILDKELIGGDGFNLGFAAGVGFSFFSEGLYTREQIHPTDPDVDNWHLSVESGYGLFAKAGLHIPLVGFFLPDVPLEWEDEWECCRVPAADYWGQGRLQVTTFTTGINPDPDGYKVLVERADTLPVVMDAGTQRVGPGWSRTVSEQILAGNDSTVFGDGFFAPCVAVYADRLFIGNPVWGLSIAGARSLGVNIPTYGATSRCPWLIARYRVTLSDVASHCQVDGGAVRDSVWLQQSRMFEPVRDDIARLRFDVSCSVAGPQGTLRVVLDPSGRRLDAAPTLLVDGSAAAVFLGDTVTLGGLAPGDYEVEIDGLRSLCIADAATATVAADQVTTVTPPLVCAEYDAPQGSVTYVATTTGADRDPNAYGITLDGAPVAHLPDNGFGEVGDLPASQPMVFMVTDIAGNCQPQGLNPRLITLNAARDPVEVPFAVECASQRPDTLIGTVDASGWPATTVTIRATDGRTLVVSGGPKAAELGRLTGSPVRVWGQASATGIDVNGYDLRSELGDDRWMGIVMDRADGLWLIGEEAIRLVDAPSGLPAQAGRLVWVMGSEVVGGVRPTLYGVIR